MGRRPTPVTLGHGVDLGPRGHDTPRVVAWDERQRRRELALQDVQVGPHSPTAATWTTAWRGPGVGSSTDSIPISPIDLMTAAFT